MAATLVVSAGTTYEMVERDGWHSVRPIDAPVLSLMVAGKPWERWSHKPTGTLHPLSEDARAVLLAEFQTLRGCAVIAHDGPAQATGRDSSCVRTSPRSRPR